MAKEKEKEEQQGEAKTEAAATPKKGGKLVLIILGVVGLILAAAVPTAILLTREKKEVVSELPPEAAQKESETAAVTGPEEEEIGEDEEALGAIYPLDTFVINLSGGQYLRAQIQVEFTQRDVPQRFHARIVPVRDLIIGLLTKRTAADLQSVKGKDTLKRDIKEAVNELLHKEEIKQVYFTQFVIQ